MAELKYKHFFTVTDGRFVWSSKEMLDFIRRQFEGKKGYALFEEEKEDISAEQYGYYFGGIIRAECMQSECFGGLRESEIHNILLGEVASYTLTYFHPKKGQIVKDIAEDFKKYSKRKMSEYIEKVIALLNTEYGIYPKPSSHYKTNNYYMDTKIYK